MSAGKAARFAGPTAATANIGRMIENAANNSTQVITEIPLSKVLRDPNNHRRLKLNWDDPALIDEHSPDADEMKEELAEIQQIAQTINNPRVGLINPITVVRRGDSFHLIAGERRVLACKLLKRGTVLAIIRTDALTRLTQFIENFQRKNIDLDEALHGMVGVMAEMGVALVPGMEPGSVAKALIKDCGIPQASAYRWAGLLTAPKVLHDAVRDRVVRTWVQVDGLLRLPEDEMIDAIAMLAVEADANSAQAQLSDAGQSPHVLTRATQAKAGRRPKEYVTLGKVRNPDVIKTVMERVLGAVPEGVNWSDLRSVERAFKKMLDELAESAK